MKILLVGEFSRLHNSLKEGLLVHGHSVTLVSAGDHFKKYDNDFSYHSIFFSDFWFFRQCNYLVYKLTSISLDKVERGLRFYFLLKKFNDFDHVQLINSDAIETFPFLSKILYRKLFEKIKSRSLLICGDETPVIDYFLKKEFKYSVLTPYLEDASLKKHFDYALKYSRKNYREVFNWLAEQCQSLITTDLDYKIPMEKMKYSSHFIPNPINIKKLQSSAPKITSKIVIFLGINRGSYVRKGIVFFEKALAIIQEKYAEKVEIIISENIAYKKYIHLYDKAHIVLDQVYCYDQGYNALEAMAKGKVVFTGAELEFEKQYNLSEEVAINAVADVGYLVQEISFLIENPKMILKIHKKAKDFIKSEHDYIKIAEKYVAVWKSSHCS